MLCKRDNGIYYTKQAAELIIKSGAICSFTDVSIESAVHHIRSVFHIRTVEDISVKSTQVLKLVSDN